MVENADEVQPLAVAKILKAIVDEEKPDLVILGKQSIDGDNNQTGQMLAALAGIGQGTFASEVNNNKKRMTNIKMKVRRLFAIIFSNHFVELM